MFIQGEIKEKKRRIRSLLKQMGLDGVYLKRQSNFAWLTGGGCNTVGITLELGVAGLLITPDKEYAICNNIEEPRMREEEKLEEQGYTVKSFLWYEDREADIVRGLCGSGPLGADHHFPDARDVSREINPLRYSLTKWEVARYRKLGKLTSQAIEYVAARLKPGDKECSVIGKLSSRLWNKRIDYITVFCAADERIASFRHPVATEKKIDKRVMICVNARMQGLIVSLTRFVQFGPVPQEIRNIYNANVKIDCTMMAHTIPGRPVKEAFLKGVEAYREAGFPDEYKLHHQGGAIGYAGRDYKVSFNTPEIVQENQAFTWNPSITGSKSEDTILAQSNGPELITKPMTFPVLKMEVAGYSFERPDILVL